MNNPALSVDHSETTAIITGGTQGLGLSVARQLVASGCSRLMLAGRSESKGAAAIEELTALGAEVGFSSIDLVDASNAGKLVESTIERFGSVNALVNGAAACDRGKITDISADQLERMLSINLKAPLFLIQRLVQHLLETKQTGSIVNVISQSAYCGQSFLTDYSVSKGALMTLTKNVANAHRYDRIRCNAVMPGWMDTPGEDATQKLYHQASDDWLAKAEQLQPFGKLIKTDELAILISYILSPQAGVMTGSLVDYDQNVHGSYPE